MGRGSIAGGRAALRVMIVEDEPDSAESLAVLLGLDGHEVQVAGTGPSALEMAGSFVPDVALIDIGLPGLDGYQVASRLRSLPAWRGAYLIALSGYGGVEDKQRALAAGFDRHMTKPVEFGALGTLLDSVAHRAGSAARLPG